MSINELPSYVQQNLAMVQDNIRTMISENAQNSAGRIDSEGMYNSVFNDIITTFSDSNFDDSFFSTKRNTDKAGSSSNIPNDSKIQDYMSSKNKLSAENDLSIKNAYATLLNSDTSKNLPVEEIERQDLTDKINKLKNKAIDKNGSLITDEEFFDSKAISASQINDILKKKGSPYANMKFDGMTAGELIYKECQTAGTTPEGNHKLNPAVILSILGAESGFGTDPKANKTNPFNIKVDGSFNKVNSFQSSLNMAVNTMYNWAVTKPKDSKVSFFDFAGDKYCENYTDKWKPNVEKYFLEFTLSDAIASKINMTKVNPLIGAEKKPDITALLSSMGGATGDQNNGGMMNMANMMQMLNGNNKEAPIDKMNLLSSMTPNSMVFGDKEE